MTRQAPMQGSLHPHLLVMNAAEGSIQLLVARLETTLPFTGTPAAQEQAHCLPYPVTPVLSQRWHVSGQGAELLIPALHNAFELMHLAPGCIRYIASVRGPGSFTGIRLVLGTSAGLARATNAFQGGIDYLWALALNAALQQDFFVPPVSCSSGTAAWGTTGQTTVQEHGPSCTANAAPPSAPNTSLCSLLVLTHARRDLVHAQWFTYTPAQAATTLAATSEILVLSLEETREALLQHHTTPLCVLGSGLTRNREWLEKALLGTAAFVCLLPHYFDTPSDTALLTAAAQIYFSTKDIHPLYARQSEAEDNIEDIARKLQLDPAEARAALERMTGK